MVMLPVVMNTAFERLGVVDDYSSFIWSRRYYTCGDFELCIPVSSKALGMLQKDFYIIRDDADDVGIIERIAVRKTESGHESMVVSGRFLPSILGRRIIAVQTQVSGTIEACVKKLIDENAVNPAISARKIPNLSYGAFTGASAKMQQQFTGTNLLEAISAICESNGLGIKMKLNEAGNGFEFSLFAGVDRSYNQDSNPYVIFSNDYDNLNSSDYEESYSGIVTDVLVAGEGEGLDRKTIWAAKNANSGLGRYELYTDARNSSTNNGEISDAVYMQQLREDGLENITSFTQVFAGNVSLANYKLGADLDIGDTVVIENSAWGIGMNARIIEIIESINEAGVYNAIPTFAPMIVSGDVEDTNAYVLHESALVLMSENDDAIIQERTTFNPVGSEYASAKRISELNEASAADDTDYFALATDAETKKLAYGTLKSDLLNYDKLVNKPSIENVVLQGDKTFSALGLNALSNSEIDKMLT